MNDFNEAASAVNTILRKNGLSASDVKAQFLKGCVTTGEQAGKTAIEITWQKSGRMEGRILYINGEELAHKALALLRGQVAEPLAMPGERLIEQTGITHSYHKPVLSF